MSQKVGILRNSKIVVISGCRVMQDQRKIRQVQGLAVPLVGSNHYDVSDGTRSPLNRKSIQREYRKLKWQARMAEQAKATERMQTEVMS